MNKTRIPHCAVCGGPFQENGEPLYCEFCPCITPEQVATLPELATSDYWPHVETVAS